MKSDRPLPVAIVGGGFSGTMVAAQLARKGIESVLIESGCRVGGASQNVSLRQALGIDPLAIGPKQDDPRPPTPEQRWILRY